MLKVYIVLMYVLQPWTHRCLSRLEQHNFCREWYMSAQIRPIQLFNNSPAKSMSPNKVNHLDHQRYNTLIPSSLKSSCIPASSPVLSMSIVGAVHANSSAHHQITYRDRSRLHLSVEDRRNFRGEAILQQEMEPRIASPPWTFGCLSNGQAQALPRQHPCHGFK